MEECWGIKLEEMGDGGWEGEGGEGEVPCPCIQDADDGLHSCGFIPGGGTCIVCGVVEVERRIRSAVRAHSGIGILLVEIRRSEWCLC